MFEEMEILNKNLQKGMERWLEKDLQQRGRTPEEKNIDDLQELKQVFIAAARAPNLGTFRQAHPELQNTEKVERSSPAQQ